MEVYGINMDTTAESAQEGYVAKSYEQRTKEFSFVTEHFRNYYLSHQVFVPFLNMREFGFGYEKKIDLRHKSFQSQKELQSYFTSRVPLYASYSAALYEYPSARPMPAKNPLKAELIFDLDADPSHEGHDPVFCSYCQQRVKSDAIRLLEDFLYPDFGFTKAEVTVNFSGSKGYHFHITSEDAMQLSANQRAQLVEYAAGTGIEAARFFSEQRHVMDGRSIKAIRGPDKNSRGWGKKILDTALALLSLPQPELSAVLKSAGYTKKESEGIQAHIATTREQLPNGNWSALEKSALFVQEVSKRARIGNGVNIDRSVTIDMSRLIRVPDTLHGDTALLAKTTTDLDSFDPSKDAVAFSGPDVRVIPVVDSNFELQGSTYSLQKEHLFEVPLPVALLLLCKKKAMLL